jgi:hypothetical protein
MAVANEVSSYFKLSPMSNDREKVKKFFNINSSV